MEPIFLRHLETIHVRPRPKTWNSITIAVKELPAHVLYVGFIRLTLPQIFTHDLWVVQVVHVCTSLQSVGHATATAMLLAPPSEDEKCNNIYTGLQNVVADQDRLRGRAQLALLAVQQQRLSQLVQENSQHIDALQLSGYKPLQLLARKLQQASRRTIATGIEAKLASFVFDHPEAAVELKRAFESNSSSRRLCDVLRDDDLWSLLQSLYPIWALTPEEVARHLPASMQTGETPFDVVLFDEASQLPLHQALGCIARSSQCIVVGDDRQLPPREGMQGLLDECIRANMPLVPLQWHYRSSHQSLIDFSNELFYFGQLESFPAGHDVQNAEQGQHGLIRVPVEGPMVSNFGRKTEIDNFIARQVLSQSFL